MPESSRSPKREHCRLRGVGKAGTRREHCRLRTCAGEALKAWLNFARPGKWTSGFSAECPRSGCSLQSCRNHFKPGGQASPDARGLQEILNKQQQQEIHEFSRSTETTGEAKFVRRVLTVAAVAAFVFLAWHLRHTFVVAFGAVVIAALLLAATDAVRGVLPLGHRWCLAISGILILIVFGLITWIIWPDLRSQSVSLLEQLPQAASNLETEFGLEITRPDGSFSDSFGGMFGRILRDAANILQTTVAAVTGFLLVVVAGVYLASDPKLYRRGLTLLFPSEQHDRVANAFTKTARALKLWLIGQLVSMTIIGLCVGIGAWWIGLPSPLALGLFAFLTEFVPLIGPFVGALPGLLISLGEGWQTLLWTAGLYLTVQQLESNLVAPLVQQEMVKVPPALFLLSAISMGTLFGVVGVVLAGPLTVAAFVLVRNLYVKETLGEPLDRQGDGN